MEEFDLEKIKKKKAVKKEKIFIKGEGVTEKVLFDDSFDWGIFDSTPRPKTDSSERLVELDLLDIGDQEPAKVQPEPEAEPVPAPEPEPAPEQRPWTRTKKILFAGGCGVMLAVILCALIYVLFFGKKPGEGDTRTSRDRNHGTPSYVYTMTLRSERSFSLPLEPFMIPGTVDGKEGYYTVTTTLLIRSLRSWDTLEDQREQVRAVIYSVLREPDMLGPDTYNGSKLADMLKDRVNRFLGEDVVSQVSIAKEDPPQEHIPEKFKIVIS